MNINFLDKEKNFNIFVLDLIHDQNIPKTFIEEFTLCIPEIENEILSFANNSNCDCKHKIDAYITVYIDKIANFINAYASKNNLIDYIKKLFDEQEIIKGDPTISVTGKIAKTKINEWEDFAKNIKDSNFTYNSFSVVKEGDKLLVFFL